MVNRILFLILALTLAFPGIALAQFQDPLTIKKRCSNCYRNKKESFYLGEKRINNLKRIDGYLYRFHDSQMNALYKEYRTNRTIGSAAFVTSIAIMVPALIVGSDC